MYETILIATDGSEIARRATAHGIELADGLGATVHALSVTKGYVNRDQIRADPDREAEEAVDAAKQEGRSRGLEVVTAVREGHPCEIIPAYATEIEADMVSTGTRGRHGENRFLLGSVAERVVRTCPVPVLTVRQLSDEETA